LDVASSFASLSIYESIFTPGMVADLVLIDTDDHLGQIKIIGDETVNMSFQVPGGVTANYKFGVQAIDGVGTVTSSLKSKQYTLKLVSEEALYAQTCVIKHAFNTQHSSAIKTILTDYLKTKKQIEVEETQGVQHIKVAGYAPYDAINMIKLRSTSTQNKSSVFVLFETRGESDQIFKFSTVEGLFKGSPVKTFQQSDGLNSNIENITHDQLLALEIPTQFNTIDRLTHSVTDVVSFDFRTHTLNKKRLTSDSEKYASGGDGNLLSSELRQKYGNPKNAKTLFIPEDNSARANTHIPEIAHNQKAYLGILLESALKIRTYGDFVLKAGAVIKLDIPNKVSTTGNKENDTFLSGNFLISRIHHDIGFFGENPRYTCVVECIKGNPEKGV